MKLEYVLTSCNLNPLYYDFIPIFIKAWKKLIPDIKIVIVLIAKEIPLEFLDYSENIKLFFPLEGVHDSFISQYIRILYPCILDSNGGVLITDMDMLPMNSEFYLKNIEKYSNDKFIHYEHPRVLPNEYAICYSVALSETWGEIFKVKTEDEIKNTLKNVYKSFNYSCVPGQEGWNKDQLDLYTFINLWNHKKDRFIILKQNETKFNRLDRIYFRGINKNLQVSIKKGKFTDYHALRPYKNHKKINDEVVDLLKKID